MDVRLPRIAPWGAIQPEHINAPSRALERMPVAVGPSSTLTRSEGPGGVVLGVRGVGDLWARITGHAAGTPPSSGPYAWTEQVERPGGTWVDGPTAGTTTAAPAFESTGNAAVPTGTIVRLRYGEAGLSWIFTYAACS